MLETSLTQTMTHLLQFIMSGVFLQYSMDLSVTAETNPCDIRSDQETKFGYLVDCSGHGLTKLNSEWFPENTTALNLDRNRLETLHNNMFANLSSLRFLSVQSNVLSQIQPDALSGLTRLRVLNIEHNPLSYHAYPLSLFKRVPNLEELYIADQQNSDYHKLADTFEDLEQLKSLSIDTGKELKIGHKFSKLYHLERLILAGYQLDKIYNSSLDGLTSLKVKELLIWQARNFIREFQLGVFRNMHHLDSLRVWRSSFTNAQLMKSLWPFEGKTFSNLEFIDVRPRPMKTTPLGAIKNGLITKEMLHPLRSMCVGHFTWAKSKIIAVEPGSFTDNNSTFSHCVTTFSFWGNLLSEFDQWRILLYQFIKCISMNTFFWGGEEYKEDVGQMYRSLQNSPFDIENKKFKNRPNVVQSGESKRPSTSPVFESKGKKVKTNTMKKSRTTIEHKSNTGGLAYSTGDITSTRLRSNGTRPAGLSYQVTNTSAVSIRFPRSLKSFTLTNFRSLGIDFNLAFHLNDNMLNEVYIRHVDHVMFNTIVYNLSNLTTVDVTGSKIYWEENNFCETILTTRTLKINSQTHLQSVHKQTNEGQIQILQWLNNLELSHNELNYIPHNIFHKNQQLERLVFSYNKFTSLPIDLETTPNLKYLDMSFNAIMSLEKNDMDQLDKHLKRTSHFRLSLNGNLMACGCSHIMFLGWMSSTHVTLDKERNYQCIDQTGKLTTTSALRDHKALWRQCVGEIWLYASLLLLTSMIFGFLLVYMWQRHKTSMMAFLLNIFVPNFRLKTPIEYRHNVFIGYANDDFHFIRHTLRRYIEDDLGLSTYIHQRDLGPGYIDQQLLDAISESWRVVLIITKNFLDRYEQAHMVMKMSCSCVSVENPGRVLVLVQEKLRARIPDYVLNVLDEDNIVRLQSLRADMSYEQKLKLRRAIIP